MSRDMPVHPRGALSPKIVLPDRCNETFPQDKPERSHRTCGTMSRNQTHSGAPLLLVATCLTDESRHH